MTHDEAWRAQGNFAVTDKLEVISPVIHGNRVRMAISSIRPRSPVTLPRCKMLSRSRSRLALVPQMYRGICAGSTLGAVNIPRQWRAIPTGLTVVPAHRGAQSETPIPAFITGE